MRDDSTSSTPAGNPYSSWSNGPATDPEFFPIAVWTQDPALAPQYRAIGVNIFMGLWQGPTPEHLHKLREARMFTICGQNAAALKDAVDPGSPIIGWMHGDEPDNYKGKGPEDGDRAPVPVAEVQVRYAKMTARDPTRPVLVNFGQGVANDAFPGRGAKLDDYPEYAKGADIVCYDVYPVANIKEPGPDGRTILRPDGEELLWYVAKGVERLRTFVDNRKPVWNILECTHIHNPDRIATPHQIRAQAWMSIIHGSRGIGWFVHDFRTDPPNAAALLDNPEMRRAVSRINHEIRDLAPVLNSPTRAGAVSVTSSDPETPVAALVKEFHGGLYLFAVGMRNRATDARFEVTTDASDTTVTVVGSGHSIPLKQGAFTDRFGPYDVRIYRLGLQE